MDENIIKLVKQSCDEKHIISRAIILHGSQAVGFANENSDYDILVITDNRNNESIDVFLTENHKKVQIEFMEFKELKQEINNYENLLFKQILDLNIIAGRVLTSKIIEADCECKNIINSYRKYRKQDALIKRFIYTATNFFGDSKTDDWILKTHSFQMAAINIGTAILIKNNIFWLHIKWQHRFLKLLLSKKQYELYLTIRWPQNLSEEKFLKNAKRLIKEQL